MTEPTTPTDHNRELLNAIQDLSDYSRQILENLTARPERTTDPKVVFAERLRQALATAKVAGKAGATAAGRDAAGAHVELCTLQRICTALIEELDPPTAPNQR